MQCVERCVELGALARFLKRLSGVEVSALDFDPDRMLELAATAFALVRALERGASGYFSKAVAAEELIEGLRRVMNGDRVLSTDLAAPRADGEASALTQRERETLRGLLSGLPPKVVAAALGISDKTLYRHRANLMEKLGARHPGELARIARERGLLVDTD